MVIPIVLCCGSENPGTADIKRLRHIHIGVEDAGGTYQRGLMTDEVWAPYEQYIVGVLQIEAVLGCLL